MTVRNTCKMQTYLPHHMRLLSLQEMIHNLDKRTLRWNFIKSLEPPRVAHIRTTNVVSKENIFAQVTVRLHTQQVAITLDSIFFFFCASFTYFSQTLLSSASSGYTIGRLSFTQLLTCVIGIPSVCTISVHRLPSDFMASPLVVFLCAGSYMLYSGELLVPSS